MKRSILLIAATSLLLSCAQEQTHPKPTEWQEVAIGANVLPLVLRMPENEQVEVHSRWNETFGRLEIIGIKNDEIFIRESSISCAQKRKELESGVFEVNYLEENDSLLIYTTSVPGSDEIYWNVYATKRGKASIYAAEQNPLIAYSREDIVRMTATIKRIKAN